MIEVIKKVCRVKNEELNEIGIVDGIEVGVDFLINGKFEEDCYFGGIADSNFEVEITSMTIAINNKTIDVIDCFNVGGLEGEIKENINIDNYGNLIFKENISDFLSSYKEKKLIEG